MYSEKFPTIERTWIYRIFPSSICPKIRREKIARKTFREESYLDEQVDRLTDTEWFAPSGLSASTTQTLYPRHSCETFPRLCLLFAILASLPPWLSRFFLVFRLFRCLRFSELLTRLFETFLYPVHRAMYDGIPLYFEESTILQIFRNTYIFIRCFL